MCLSIIAVICCFAMPLTETLHQKNHLYVTAGEIKTAIHYAKTQILLHHSPAILRPLSDSNGWSSGIGLYDSDTRLIHEWQWPSRAIQVSWHGFQSNHALLFAPDIRQSTSNGYFLIENNGEQKKLIVNRLGRIKDE